MTHQDIKDKDLRSIMARELLSFRRLRKESRVNLKDDYFFGAMVGFETALRRVQMDREIERL
jgi:hypothetical protein